MVQFGTPVFMSANRAWKLKLFMNIDRVIEHIHLRYIQFFTSVRIINGENPGGPGVIL